MKITTRTIGDCRVLDCSGKIALGPATEAFREAVHAAAKDSPKRVVVNLGEVTFLDTAGLGELISGRRYVMDHGGEMVLMNATKRIHQVLIITRLSTEFELFEDEKAALAV